MTLPNVRVLCAGLALSISGCAQSELSPPEPTSPQGIVRSLSLSGALSSASRHLHLEGPIVLVVQEDPLAKPCIDILLGPFDEAALGDNAIDIFKTGPGHQNVRDSGETRNYVKSPPIGSRHIIGDCAIEEI